MRGQIAFAVVTILAACGLQSADAQQMYRWVDKDGRVTYSQNPPPAGAAKSVQQKRLASSVIEASDLPYAAQIAMRNFPVVLHTSPDCGAGCASARDSLKKRGIPYREVVASDEPSIEALRKLTGAIQVPVLQVGNEVLKGFEPGAWKNALDQAGYPLSIPTSARQPEPRIQRNLPPVRLFTSAQCGVSCQSAKDLLTARRVTFQEISVDEEAGLEAFKKAGGNNIVPLLMVGGSQAQGFEAGRYSSLLDGAGFPNAPAARK